MRSIPTRGARLPALIGLSLWLLSSAAPQSSAQTCIGDCRGLGRVSISDLVLAVGIVLGQTPLDACPALGPAPVTVAQVIASVNSALCACAPCPTPPPTRTFTRTPLPSPTLAHTATPVASATPMAIVSTWREDNLKVPMSNCPRRVTDEIRQQLAGIVSEYTVRQYADRTELVDSDGDVMPATLDGDGTLRASETTMESDGVCVATVELALTVDISDSPTNAKYVAIVSTMHCPTMVNCRMQITGRWTRLDAALHARRAGRRLTDVLRAAARQSTR